MQVRLGPVRARFTGRKDGDFEPTAEGVEARRRSLVDARWSWLRQVHGARVVVVEGAGDGAGEIGDALVAAAPDAVLSVVTADCAPVALGSPEGVMAAVHAGWRGLLAGVLERAVEAALRLGASRLEAAIGPCIHPECYEFSEADLDRVAAAVGEGVRAWSARGRPALDLPRAIETVLGAAGVRTVAVAQACTGCSGAYFSHRRGDGAARQALVVWREDAR